ncbi:MAG: beta strand repeat-containing protein, partial [Alphaproteobacteria bacterium]
MKFRSLLLSSVFSIAMIGTVNAATLTMTQDEYFSGGADYSDNSSASLVAGLYNPSGGTYEITTDGNIYLNNNSSSNDGAFGLRSVSSVLKIINISSSQDITIQMNNNSSTAMTGSTDDNAFGLNQAPGGSVIIENMNVEANNNISANRGGFGIENLGTFNAKGNVSGVNYLKANGNIGGTGGRGIGNTGTMLIENMDVEANENLYGVVAHSGGEVLLTGNVDGSNSVVTNKNQNLAATIGVGMQSNGANSLVDIKNMNIQTNENIHGMQALDGGKVNIEGIAGGTNTLQANNNKNVAGTDGIGIYVKDANSEINIENMNIEANGNGKYGIGSFDGGSLEITGIVDGSNTLQVNDNMDATGSGVGIYTYGNNTQNTIKNMDVEANGNGGTGILVYEGTILELEGSNINKNKLTANNNMKTDGSLGRGIQVQGNGVATTKISIENMDIEVSENIYGIIAHSGGQFLINGNASGDNYFIANNNKDTTGTSGIGIQANGTDSLINIENMNIQANGNGVYGVQAVNTSKINITGIANGSNILQANNNVNTVGTDGKGLYSLDVGSEINIENMNIQANGNAKNGILASNGGKINISGITTGTNYIQANNNNGHAQGFGIYSVGADSEINISDMDIEAKGNSFRGISSTTGAKLNIIGRANERNKIIFSDNASGTSFSTSVKDTGGFLNVENMNIYTSDNTLALVKNEGDFRLSNSDVYMISKGLGFDVAGNADITLDNVKIYDATTLISTRVGEDSTDLGMSGTINLTTTNSELSGAAINDNLNGNILNTNLSNSIWRSIGRSNVSNLSLIGSNDLYMSIYFGNSATQGDMLTIDNNISTSGGTNTLHLTSAGGDGGSADAIVINQENATGSTLN